MWAQPSCQVDTGMRWISYLPSTFLEDDFVCRRIHCMNKMVPQAAVHLRHGHIDLDAVATSGQRDFWRTDFGFTQEEKLV